MLKNFLFIGLGGAIGSVLRYSFLLIFTNKEFPLATLLVNIIGSFFIGIVFALTLKNENFATNYKLFFATGLCGGFTTFSAFSLENLQLLQQQKFTLVALNITVSIAAGLLATYLGYKLITATT
jgi:fluoride exporter